MREFENLKRESWRSEKLRRGAAVNLTIWEFENFLPAASRENERI
jgi:hypothetical protein